MPVAMVGLAAVPHTSALLFSTLKWLGVAFSILNPKQSIFFPTFLPQFIAPYEAHPR